MAVPKRKVSKRRKRARKSTWQTAVTASGTCSNCGATKATHRMCPACGYYRDRQVRSVEAE